MFRYFFAVSVSLLLVCAGCKHLAEETPSDPNALRPHMRRDTRIYVGTPLDAIYKKEPVLDSGRRTGLELKAAFGKISNSVFLGRNNEVFADALDRARTTRAQFLIFPTILKWEDHPTEWNGIPDKVEIKLDVVEVGTGGILYSTIIRAHSQFMTDGGDHPEMLLAEPFGRFAQSLLKSESVPSALR
jgi:hypothetical protein